MSKRCTIKKLEKELELAKESLTVSYMAGQADGHDKQKKRLKELEAENARLKGLIRKALLGLQCMGDVEALRVLRSALKGGSDE